MLLSEESVWAFSRSDLKEEPLERRKRMIGASVSLSGTMLGKIEEHLQEVSTLTSAKSKTLGRYVDIDAIGSVVLDDTAGFVLAETLDECPNSRQTQGVES